MERRYHTAWTPTSLPNSIVLLGGTGSAGSGLGTGSQNAEIVPGIFLRRGHLLLPLRWWHIRYETHTRRYVRDTRKGIHRLDWRRAQLCHKVEGWVKGWKKKSQNSFVSVFVPIPLMGITFKGYLIFDLVRSLRPKTLLVSGSLFGALKWVEHCCTASLCW